MFEVMVATAIETYFNAPYLYENYTFSTSWGRQKFWVICNSEMFMDGNDTSGEGVLGNESSFYPSVYRMVDFVQRTLVGLRQYLFPWDFLRLASKSN